MRTITLPPRGEKKLPLSRIWLAEHAAVAAPAPAPRARGVDACAKPTRRRLAKPRFVCLFACFRTDVMPWLCCVRFNESGDGGSRAGTRVCAGSRTMTAAKRTPPRLTRMSTPSDRSSSLTIFSRPRRRRNRSVKRLISRHSAFVQVAVLKGASEYLEGSVTWMASSCEATKRVATSTIRSAAPIAQVAAIPMDRSKRASLLPASLKRCARCTALRVRAVSAK